MIKDITNAIANEIVVEKYLYKTLGITPGEMGYLPRISKLHNNKRIRQLVWLSRLIHFFWAIIVFPVLCTSQLIKMVLVKRKLPQVAKSEIGGMVIVPSSDVAIGKVVEATGIQHAVAVCRPLESYRNHDNIKLINALSILSYAQVFSVFFQSIYCNFELSHSKQYGKWRFQNYVFFEWLLMRKALWGIEAQFYMVDHFDRWAVLLDIISECSEKSRLHLVQHGLLVLDFTNIDSRLEFDLDCKLKNVDELYVFDDASRDIFVNQILSSNNRRDSNLVVHKCPPQLNLTSLDHHNPSVLYVGHTLISSFHQAVLAEVQKQADSKDIVHYYKPHPSQTANYLVPKGKWIVIDDVNRFPDVDVVVSYQSTLGFEYFMMGKTVITHSFDEELGSAAKIAQEIRRELVKEF